MRAGAGGVAVLVVLAAACAGRADRIRPEDVPAPVQQDLQDAPVQAQFQERREAVLKLLARPDAGDDDLANALGELGIVFHAYGYHAQAEDCYAYAARLAPRSFRWAYALGLTRQERGNGAGADTALRDALRLDPQNVPARVRLAQVAIEWGRRDEAESLFREALARDQDCLPALVGLARLALEKRRPAEAAELFERALAWQPEAVAIHQGLGMAYRELGQTERAREHLRRVPSHKLDQGPLPLADPLLADIEAARLGARGHDLRAIRALNTGQFDLAAIEFRQALLSDPDRVYARHGLAQALFRAGKLPEAAEALRELLRRDRSHAPSRLLLARVLAAQGQLTAARETMEAMLEESPDDPDAVLELADVDLAQGRLQAAVAGYRRVLALSPGRPEARVGAGLALLRLGRRKEALDVLTGGGPAAPADPRAALLAARLLAASPEDDVRNGQRALELARRAWETEPTLSAAESMAMAEAETGRLQAAAAWQREAARVPGPERPWVARRLALYESGRPAREPWARGERLVHERVLAPEAASGGTTGSGGLR